MGCGETGPEPTLQAWNRIRLIVVTIVVVAIVIVAIFVVVDETGPKPIRRAWNQGHYLRGLVFAAIVSVAGFVTKVGRSPPSQPL